METLTAPFNLTQEQINNDYACGICLATDDHLPYVNHTNSNHNGFHQQCLKPWIPKSSTCPTCRVKLSVPQTATEKIVGFAKKLFDGARLALKYTHNPQVTATFAAISISALIAGQNDLAYKIHSIFGLGCAATSVYTTIIQFNHSELEAENKAEETGSQLGHAVTLIGIAALFYGVNEGGRLAAAAGALALLYRTGRVVVAKGVVWGTAFGLGTAAAKELNIINKPTLSTAKMGGRAGILANFRTTPYLISLFAMATGAAVSALATRNLTGVNRYLQLASGAMFGGAAASTTASVLDQGYQSYKQFGFMLL